MICEKLNNCLFYHDKMPMEKGIGSIYKKKYCEGNYRLCARYMVFNELGESFVPISLFPNMTDVAEKIIKDEKNK
ncbi:MAG: hypothetical protein VB095_02645 [Anaerovorax sp.]|nr:hypothetical protein [Anaerovorax sp.]